MAKKHEKRGERRERRGRVRLAVRSEAGEARGVGDTETYRFSSKK